MCTSHSFKTNLTTTKFIHPLTHLIVGLEPPMIDSKLFPNEK
jgi:hypothetical protein